MLASVGGVAAASTTGTFSAAPSPELAAVVGDRAGAAVLVMDVGDAVALTAVTTGLAVDTAVAAGGGLGGGVNLAGMVASAGASTGASSSEAAVGVVGDDVDAVASPSSSDMVLSCGAGTGAVVSCADASAGVLSSDAADASPS